MQVDWRVPHAGRQPDRRPAQHLALEAGNMDAHLRAHRGERGARRARREVRRLRGFVGEVALPDHVGLAAIAAWRARQNLAAGQSLGDAHPAGALTSGQHGGGVARMGVVVRTFDDAHSVTHLFNG